jgi:hypothetical protein
MKFSSNWNYLMKLRLSLNELYCSSTYALLPNDISPIINLRNTFFYFTTQINEEVPDLRERPSYFTGDREDLLAKILNSMLN